MSPHVLNRLKSHFRQQKPAERVFTILRDMLHSLPQDAPKEIPFEEGRVKCIIKGTFLFSSLLRL